MEPIDAHQLVAGLFHKALPMRSNQAHKGQFGSLAIIGGATGMVGAALLAARAALYCGAGRVYAAMLCENAPSVDILQPEIMLRSPPAISQLSQLDCVVIGTGLGQSDAALALLKYYLAQNIPLLLDADALNLIAHHAHLAALVSGRNAATVITPHAGEAARLLSVSAEQIQQNRTECALKLAHLLHASCVLKGADTVCAHHDGSWFVNTTGNVGLASGGTGDVLSGIIGSLLAQGLAGIEAAKLGVYVHGAAADALVQAGKGPAGLTASEVALEARNIINKLYQTK